jgi:hypothetical protein
MIQSRFSAVAHGHNCLPQRVLKQFRRLVPLGMAKIFTEQPRRWRSSSTMMWSSRSQRQLLSRPIQIQACAMLLALIREAVTTWFRVFC